MDWPNKDEFQIFGELLQRAYIRFIYRGKPILDLDYKEDSAAEADANFVITDKNKIIEIQATAEQYPFSEKMFLELMMLAKSGIEEIIKKQKDVLEN